jgi:hypothetical protein
MTCPGATEPTLECYVGGLIYPSVEVEPPLSEDQTGGVWIVYGSMTEGMSEDVGGEVFDFYVQDGRSAAASPQLDLYYSVLQDDGGYMLKALATNRTLCSNGWVRDECYVGNLILTGLELTPNDEETVWGQLLNSGTVKGYYIENPDYVRSGWPDLRDLFVTEANGEPPLW